jgi:sterol desaturase/sphingolipid hydroxylase (fatty acid hydroxylase superfamily)
MHLDNTILYPALPAILILIGAEAVFMIKEHRHDNKDMISSICLALGALPVSVIIKGVVIYSYTLIYQYRLFTIPVNRWWALVILFFGDDLSYYWYHRMSHQIRFLWASHMVHHSSEKFTLSSGLRVPWTSNLTGTFLFWAWLPLIGVEPYMVIFMKSVSIIYQFWMHTETISKLPKWFETVFNTPSHHRVHHSSNLEYLDKNHAGTLIIWDKLFGTYQEEISKPKYGLTEDIKSFNPFVVAFHEWKNILRDLKKTKNIKDRLGYFFKPPGWSHNGTTKTTRQLQSELKAGKTTSDLISFTNII